MSSFEKPKRTRKVAAPVEAVEAVEAAPILAPRVIQASIAEQAAIAFNAELTLENVTTATFKRGELGVCINPKAHTLESIKSTLRAFGF
jgi:hypothetical protein